jgi:hypothetical protein
MSYLTQNEIAGNSAMVSRVAQCAAQEDVPEPDVWTQQNRRDWAAAPGWDAAWESARASHPEPDPGEGPVGAPYDPGADEAVITDAQILAQVQGMQTGPGRGGES